MKTYHIDVDFEGERLVDDVKLIEKINQRSVMIFSPRLRANIIINKKELKSRLNKIQKGR